MNSEQMMLKAVSTIGRARGLKEIDEPLSIEELIRGVALLNEAIALEPDNVENRRHRLWHLLGITKNSPKDYLDTVKKDLNFFEKRFDSLIIEDKAYYLTAYGEYLLYIGKDKEGLEVLKNVVENYVETSVHSYSEVLYKTYKN